MEITVNVYYKNVDIAVYIFFFMLLVSGGRK